ncbi:hypothetical protein [Clostridium sp. AM58-1XD]|uniref:hypothetical protein n=1 Tax=Clostridium sp. AM58-1XD TaxID=2292307 RepID=UPI000E52AB10|nr:hypothetical protein [Clostridium sp. AM58-1XD]RGZ00612.1 hypothetical protein DXA13_04000 [Clostridium sp. AM58-1XD]
MYDIRKLNVGDTFYCVYDFNCIKKLSILVPFRKDRNTLGALCEKNGEKEFIACDLTDFDMYFIDKTEAEEAFKKALNARIKELSDIPTLLEALFEEYSKHTSNYELSSLIYRNAIEMAKLKLNDKIYV